MTSNPFHDLDIEKPDDLLAYLRATHRIEKNETPMIRNLAGGVSNRTVLLQRESGEGWVLKQALAKLRVKVDWFSDPVRIHREALGLRWLAQLAPGGTTTPLIFEDETCHLLAMQAVPQPHEQFKTLLLEGTISPAQQLELVRQFGELLGAIHRQAYEKRLQIAMIFDDRTFFQTLRVEPYYQFTATQVPAAADFVNDLVTRTRTRHLTLVHGDYSPKNVLVRNGKLVLLDHEVIHWGDPAFDLGFGLTHLLSKARHLRNRQTDFAASAKMFWKSYRHALGDVPWTNDLESMTIRHTLGIMLARAKGRSPLEYLDVAARDRQRDAVLSILKNNSQQPLDQITIEKMIELLLEKN